MSIKEPRASENYIVGEYGIKYESPFTSLEPIYHPTQGLPPCLGHDLFHGCFRRDLLLILNYFVNVKNLFTLNELNCKLKHLAKLHGKKKENEKLKSTIVYVVKFPGSNRENQISWNFTV